MQWWAAAYTVAFGVLLAVGGRLGDIYGGRRVFAIGISGFTLASAACAAAASAGALIATRVLQGAFGALLIPQGLGVLKAVFGDEEMGKAYAAFGPVMGLSAVAGPILAGWLVQQVANSAGVAVLGTVFFPLVEHGHGAPAATARTVLLAAGLFAVALALSFRLPREARPDRV